MRNITEDIKKSIYADIPWRINQFYSFLEEIKLLDINILYSNGEDNWASIVSNNTLIGYVWRKYPLVFIVTDKASALDELWEHFEYIVLITVSDLSSNELIIDAESDIIDRLRYSNYDNPTSASDIWFYTVT
jgi:hypothetical protein